jgi:hypothetical protein
MIPLMLCINAAQKLSKEEAFKKGMGRSRDSI